VDRQRLNLTDKDQIRATVRSVRPDVIVNAAAYTAVDLAESEPAIAYAVNAEAPRLLAEEAKQTGAWLVHYSTDYVFDGNKKSPYHETDQPNPQNVYGKTKLDGERGIVDSGAPHLIFRTAWVYATHGRNFLLKMLSLATQRESLTVVCDQIGAPTSAWEIARATTQILAEGYRRRQDSWFPIENSGVYHMTAQGETTWYEFARAILEEESQCRVRSAWLASTTNNLPVIAKSVVPISTNEYPSPARRPPYSVLCNARLARTFGVTLPDWRGQLHSSFTSVPADRADS
jgi:dTDP-4-dehydrorhamnose reductase